MKQIFEREIEDMAENHPDHAGMGYRSMWGRLKKIEQRIGTPLLVRRKGGISGGESVLTPEAKLMIGKFRQLQQQINDAAKKIHTCIYS